MIASQSHSLSGTRDLKSSSPSVYTSSELIAPSKEPQTSPSMLWRTERHILDEQPTAPDFARPATTPWINAFQLKGMQRSSKIDVSELINILKLELFSPPTRAKESNAQRARRVYEPYITLKSQQISSPFAIL